jgi:hypothetical protein
LHLEAAAAAAAAASFASGADFNNTFRRLTMVPMPPPSPASANGNSNATSNGAGSNDAAAAGSNGGSSNGGGGCSGDDFGGFLSQQLAELATPGEMAAASKPTMPMEQVQVGGGNCLLLLFYILLPFLLQGLGGNQDRTLLGPIAAQAVSPLFCKSLMLWPYRRVVGVLNAQERPGGGVFA